MRPNRAAAIAVLSVAGVLAAPAIADVPAEAPTNEPATFPQPAKAAAEALAVARKARSAQAQRRRAQRPTFPLAGAPDYGTAENAFGASRYGHSHSGQDIFAPAGTPLVAVTEGTVVDAGTDGGQGNFVHLYEEDENRTYVYMHMVAPPQVKTGETVEAGQRLGGVGCTGSCWGDHLHFEVREGKGWGGTPQDPMPLLQEWAKRG
jgi:murein DD-endopeptidase MepM/ murein hydrolase activator NlpD